MSVYKLKKGNLNLKCLNYQLKTFYKPWNDNSCAVWRAMQIGQHTEQIQSLHTEPKK